MTRYYKTPKLKFSALVSLIAWGYVILFTVWMVLRLLFFDRFWWLAVINTLALYLFVPLLLLLPLALLWRRWKAFLGLCFPLGVFIALYSPFFLPHSVTVSPIEKTFTAMSFNMLFSNTDYDAIANVIETSTPDIIGIQEVPPNGDAVWIKRFSSDYPNFAFRPVEDGHNVGIMSRFPIESVTMLPNSPMRRALSAAIRVDTDKRLQVIVSHLTPNYPIEKLIQLASEWFARRANEVNYIRSLVKQRSVPTIMLCDCNYVNTSEAYARTHEVMKDSFREVGWGFGHTALINEYFRAARIDFVWYTQELQAIEARVIDGGGSDHLPIIAKLQF
ncbi:MAG: endonuclease/exonuclease/phosphatase family protein [Calothrix sp. C42_A2020_038]|nr:endonuclease/exonuclease/phosphatase family protein [Calothrix sp. C42_A2020_038]